MEMKTIVRYLMLIVGVSIMALGISLSIKASLGTSPIASPPYVLSIVSPVISVGLWVIVFNALLVVLQMFLLRTVNLKQISQMIVCVLFGYMTDFTLWLLGPVNPSDYLSQWIICIIGAFVLAFGIMTEVKSGVTFLPGDGAVQAFAEVTGSEFSKVKPYFDVSMVILAVIIALVFLGHLEGVREGTVFAAVAVGFIIQFYNKIFGYKIDEYLSDDC